MTDRGGRTANAAIVRREIGVTAVGGTDDATRRLEDGQLVTVSCADGESGKVYEGRLDWDETTIDLDAIPGTRTKVMMNLASPGAALKWWRMPADGIELARTEFVINDDITVHPHALLRLIVRTSETRSNEYADVIGGHRFVPDEENPVLGWRGASRYDDPTYREAFAL